MGTLFSSLTNISILPVFLICKSNSSGNFSPFGLLKVGKKNCRKNSTLVFPLFPDKIIPDKVVSFFFKADMILYAIYLFASTLVSLFLLIVYREKTDEFIWKYSRFYSTTGPCLPFLVTFWSWNTPRFHFFYYNSQ